MQQIQNSGGRGKQQTNSTFSAPGLEGATQQTGTGGERRPPCIRYILAFPPITPERYKSEETNSKEDAVLASTRLHRVYARNWKKHEADVTSAPLVIAQKRPSGWQKRKQKTTFHRSMNPSPFVCVCLGANWEMRVATFKTPPEQALVVYWRFWGGMLRRMCQIG